MRQSKIQFQRTKLEPSETYYHKMENSHKNEIHKTTSHSECIQFYFEVPRFKREYYISFHLNCQKRKTLQYLLKCFYFFLPLRIVFPIDVLNTESHVVQQHTLLFTEQVFFSRYSIDESRLAASLVLKTPLSQSHPLLGPPRSFQK